MSFAVSCIPATNPLMVSWKTNIKIAAEAPNPAKSVAESYRRTVMELCDRVSQDFPIDNHFLDSHSDRNDFIQITDNLFGSLKPPETRIAISPDEYKELQKEFQHYSPIPKKKVLL